MADLLASNVTTIASWREGGANGQRRLVKRVKWTSTTAGSTANKLLASAFGLKVIESCGHVLLDASTKRLFPAVPSADGSHILLANLADATDASRNAAADLATSTDFAFCEIAGYP